MDTKSKIIFSGIWLYPISLIAVYALMNSLTSFNGSSLTLWGHLLVWGIALLPSVAILFRNGYDFIFLKKRRFTLKNQFVKDPTEYTHEKVRSMYPPVPDMYLSLSPEGFILGKHEFRYFRIPMRPDNILHGCIIGAPGSGKSAGPYLCTLQANFMQKNPPMTVFVIDIKPELATKSVELYENASVKVVNPTDRSSWGWNVYYQLNDKSTDEEVLHVLDGISRALITSSNPKDAFFVNQAQTIFQGMCLYYYKKPHNNAFPNNKEQYH